MGLEFRVKKTLKKIFLKYCFILKKFIHLSREILVHISGS